MFDMGSPLGWDESYEDNQEQQDSFFAMVSNKIPDLNHQSELFFNDVLDNIALYYVIKQEYNQAQAEQSLSEEDLSSDIELSERSDSKSDNGSSDDSQGNKAKKDKRDDKSSSSDHDGGGASGAVVEKVKLKRLTKNDKRTVSDVQNLGKASELLQKDLKVKQEEKKKKRQKETMAKMMADEEKMLEGLEGMGNVSVVAELKKKKLEAENRAKKANPNN